MHAAAVEAFWRTPGSRSGRRLPGSQSAHWSSSHLWPAMRVQPFQTLAHVIGEAQTYAGEGHEVQPCSSTAR